MRVCWVVLVNGERRGTAFASRDEAHACRAAWLAEFDGQGLDACQAG